MPTAFELPIFPLNSVLYPEGLLPLRIFEPRYVEMRQACMRDETAFGVCLILDGHEAGAPAAPHAVGCSARITSSQTPAAGVSSIVARGERRFRILRRWVEGNGLVRAQVEWLDEAPPAPVPDSHWKVALMARTLLSKVPEAQWPLPMRSDDAAWVCHRLAELLPFPRHGKQRLLETDDPMLKLALLSKLLHSLGIDE